MIVVREASGSGDRGDRPAEGLDAFYWLIVK